MSYTAILAYSGLVSEIPDELIPFITFKAGLEKRNVSGNDKVVVLRVDKTDSYYPIFADERTTMDSILKELRTLDTIPNDVAMNELRRVFG